VIVIAEIELSDAETHRLLRLLLAADGAPGHWDAASAIIFAGIPVRRPLQCF
jgi:hypothetical protein